MSTIFGISRFNIACFHDLEVARFSHISNQLHITSPIPPFFHYVFSATENKLVQEERVSLERRVCCPIVEMTHSKYSSNADIL